MSEFNIEVQGGSSVRLPTAGKYCDRDIIVTASGGGGTEESAKWKDQIQQSLYANNGTGSDSYISVFRNTAIKDISMFDYSQRKSLQIAFSGCSEIENIEIDASSAINIQNMCAECKKLKSVKFTKGTPNLSILLNAFRNCVSLERVETMNFSSVTNFGNSSAYPFSGCSALKELRVDANSIKVSFAMYHQTELSADSIQSIVDGLAYVESSQNLTLNYQVTVTDNQKQVIRDKGWTLIQ